MGAKHNPPVKERDLPTVGRVREVLRYDPTTGEFFWRKSLGIVNCVGKPAGGPNHKGYIRITIDGKTIMAHWLAWLMCHGVWPPSQIDHKNGDKSDNRIKNLRLATNSQNHANKVPPKNNTSGYKGVVWDATAKRWRASIKVRGTKRYLGVYRDRRAAAQAYNDGAERYFGEFAKLNETARTD